LKCDSAWKMRLQRRTYSVEEAPAGALAPKFSPREGLVVEAPKNDILNGIT
jgi:hypothetical protein